MQAGGSGAQASEWELAGLLLVAFHNANASLPQQGVITFSAEKKSPAWRTKDERRIPGGRGAEYSVKTAKNLGFCLAPHCHTSGLCAVVQN